LPVPDPQPASWTVANLTELPAVHWRLLCPGPMVEEPPIGLARLRVSVDRLPVETLGAAAEAPDDLLVPLFAQRLPEMIVPYADASELMLDHLQPVDTMSRHRIGLALPIGMQGTKEDWSARPATADIV
jgi:uncharacterized protein